ncbi:MAG: hypothetical protein JO064_03635 [Actinobacteria bacterium]|nr:hypothetical protein [Actinomycetota bacterium]
MWTAIIFLLILKIPIVYVCWVVWWAVKAEPEVGAEGGTEGINWKPWQRPPRSRPPRGGPHDRRRDQRPARAPEKSPS